MNIMKQEVRIFYTSERIKEIEDAIRKVLGLEVKVNYLEKDFGFAYNRFRNQYDAIKILNSLNVEKGSLNLLVVDFDIFVEALNFCFGVAYGNKAVISLTRLKPTFYGLEHDEKLFKERCMKEAVHEVCHMLALGHCNDKNCVMYFSHGIKDTDRKSYTLCKRCSSLLNSLLMK